MDTLVSLPAFAALAFGYVLGSVPFGYLLTRAAGLGDVRQIGSGNIGATNVLRTGHKGLAALTLLLDALKGTAAVVIAHYVGAGHGVAIMAGLLAGLGAFLGHLFPVWLGFKGGKGVATGSGVALTLMPIPGAAAFVGWIITAAIFRYVSLASIVASVILVTLRLTLTPQPFGPNSWLVSGFCILGTLFVMFKHRSNIQRLLNGTESKIGDRAPQISTTSTSS